MTSPNSNTDPVSIPLPAWTRVLALALGGLCLASASGYAPSVPVEDDQRFCGRCFELFGDTHVAVADPDAVFGAGPAHPSIEENRWHTRMIEGKCLWTHGICYNAGAEGRRDPGELTDALAQAAAREDAAGLTRLVRMPNVRLVAGRSAIQVVGCDGVMIVGHVPVAHHLLERVAARTEAGE